MKVAERLDITVNVTVLSTVFIDDNVCHRHSHTPSLRQFPGLLYYREVLPPPQVGEGFWTREQNICIAPYNECDKHYYI